MNYKIKIIIPTVFFTIGILGYYLILKEGEVLETKVDANKINFCDKEARGNCGKSNSEGEPFASIENANIHEREKDVSNSFNYTIVSKENMNSKDKRKTILNAINVHTVEAKNDCKASNVPPTLSEDDMNSLQSIIKAPVLEIHMNRTKLLDERKKNISQYAKSKQLGNAMTRNEIKLMPIIEREYNAKNKMISVQKFLENNVNFSKEF